MTVKQLIGKCLAKLNLEDFTANPKTDREKNMMNALLNALSAVYGEIISDHLPLIATEEAVFKDGKLSATELSKQAIYPISVQKDGIKLDFGTDAEYIYAGDSGPLTVTYAYMPSAKLSAEDEVKLMGASEDLLSDGMLAQYYLAAGQYDLARSYDSVYREKLWKLRYKNKDMRIKERRWLK